MITLRLAAVVAALVTITLNAHNGFKSSTVFEYAILFATLNAALDLAKCSCLVGMGRAFQQGRPITGLLLLILFVPLFLNSLWCGVSEVTISRAADTGQQLAATKATARTEADHARLTAEVATMQASPTFTASAGCALPKSQTAKDYCAKVEQTKAALASTGTQLSSPTPADPEPQFTLLATLTGWSLASLKLSQALSLVILAELVGSVGFYLSARISPQVSGTPSERFWVRWRPKPLQARENASLAVSGPLAPPSAPPARGSSAPSPPPTLTWTLPKPS